MLESLFQFLFEYRLTVFRQGDFRFAPPAGAPVAAAVVIAAVVIAFVSYRVLRTRVRWRERATLVALRVVALAIVLFCIFRPVLVVKAAVTQQNVVGTMQTRDDLYDYLNYHSYEKKLDELFSRGS